MIPRLPDVKPPCLTSPGPRGPAFFCAIADLVLMRSRMAARPFIPRPSVAERALLSTLRAGCHAPVGGYATVAGQKLTLRGRVLAKDGSYEVAGEMTGGLGAAQELGEALAQKLLAEGAGALLGT